VHRLFANTKSAKLLCWHGEERKKDTMTRHGEDPFHFRVNNYMYSVHSNLNLHVTGLTFIRPNQRGHHKAQQLI
jgi:hypothetical protein